MAEVLVAAASAIAISSMVIRLYDGAHNLRQFLTGMRDNPNEILAVINELSDLLLVLNELELAFSHTAFQHQFEGALAPSDPNLTTILRRTISTMEDLTDIFMKTDGYGKVMSTQKRLLWRVRTTNTQISNLRDRLRECRTTLATLVSIAILKSENNILPQIEEISMLAKAHISKGQSESHDGPDKIKRIMAMCTSLQQAIGDISTVPNSFRSITLELQRLRQALVDLQTLIDLRSTAQIPTTDYLPALNITYEALNPALDLFSKQRVPMSTVEVASWWAQPETQRQARKYLSRFESSRAALIAAQLAVTSRYKTRENSAIAAISKNLDYLPSPMSTAIRVVFQNQVDGAMAGEDMEERRVCSKNAYSIDAFFARFLILTFHSPPERSEKFDKRDEERTQCTILPPKWLLPIINYGLQFEEHNHYSDLRLRVFTVSRSNTSIFEACRALDIGRLRYEIEIRTSSPFIVNETGRGLMDIALGAIINVVDVVHTLEKDPQLALQSGADVIGLLLHYGCSFENTGRLFLGLSGPTPRPLSVEDQQKWGLIPGWMLLRLIEMDFSSQLELVWTIRETWVLASELRHDWWYHIYHECHSLFGEGKAVSNATRSNDHPDLERNHHYHSDNDSDDDAIEFMDASDTPQSVMPTSFHSDAKTIVVRRPPIISDSTFASENASTVDDDTNVFSLNENVEPGSTLATSISNQDRPTIATDELIRLLEEQPGLKRQFDLAPLVMDTSSFQELLRTLLRRFGSRLMVEASIPLEEAVGQMIILQSRFIGTVLCRSVFPDDIPNLLERGSLEDQGSMTMDEKLGRLWKSLEANVPETIGDEFDDPELDFEEKSDLPFLTTIRDVQGFLLSTDAFSELQSQLQNSIGIDNGKKSSFSLDFIAKWSGRIVHFLWAILQKIIFEVQVLMRPPVSSGYRRLEWKCECGEDLYADFDNSDPESIKYLKLELDRQWVPPNIASQVNNPYKTKNSHTSDLNAKEYGSRDITMATAHAAPALLMLSSLQQEVLTHTVSPNQAAPMTSHAKPVGNMVSTSSNSSQAVTLSTATASGKHSSISPTSSDLFKTLPVPATAATISLPETVPLYMEICVKHKEYVSRHTEVQVELSEDDYHFFKRVKRAYLKIRRPRWNIFLRPLQIKHVQFSVQSMGSVVGIFHHDGPRIPPPEDVKNGSYHYHPCPWPGEPVPSNIILHELNSKNSQLHTSRTWSTRIPKKCAASIFSLPNPDDAAIGYGIHIIEGCDSTVLIIMVVLGMCITAMATGLWWTKGNPGDIQGATGLGSLILAGFGALIICYQALPS